MAVSIIIAITIPLIFLYVIRELELYGISSPWLLFASLVWGVVAFGLAFAINSSLLNADIVTMQQLRVQVAPMLEELLKAAFLLLLAWRFSMFYAISGTAYGFAIGIGFAICENFIYLRGDPNGAVHLAVMRVLSTNLMHAFNTAMIGTAIGSNSSLSSQRQRPRIIAVCIVAILFHAVFNTAVSDLQGTPLLLSALGMGLGSTAIIIFLINRALKYEQQAIQRELTGIMTDGELAAALDPQRLLEKLHNDRISLGGDRIETIQEYIQLQAERGILRKGIALSQRSRHTRQLQRQLERIEAQIRILQNNMGVYTRVWLRSVLPSDESDLWANLRLDTDQPLLTLISELNQRSQQISAAELAERRAVLKTTRLFRKLEDDELTELAVLLDKSTYRKGYTAMRQAKPNAHLHIVASGSLTISVANRNNQQVILNTLKRGDFFGEMSMIDGQPASATVTCIESATCYQLYRGDFLTLVYAEPQIGIETMRQLIGLLRQQGALIIEMQNSTS